MRHATGIKIILLLLVMAATLAPLAWLLGIGGRWENLAMVLGIVPDPVSQQFLRLDLLKWIFNSFFVATWITTLHVFSSALSAYAFSRLIWRGRDAVFAVYLATLMLPPLVLTIPQFQIMVSLNLVNTYAGLIIPLAFSAVGTFWLRQWMLTLPRAYDEAAALDGAQPGQIFWYVIMPACRGGISVLAIFTFLGNYNNLLWAMVTIKDGYLRTVPLGLLVFQGQYTTQFDLLMSATLIALLPLMVIFILGARKFYSSSFSAASIMPTRANLVHAVAATINLPNSSTASASENS